MILRHAERATLLLAALAGVAKVASASGAPVWPLQVLLMATAAVASLAAFSRKARWLDPWRLPLVFLLLLSLPQVFARIKGDGAEYYVLARSALFDRDLDLSNDFAGLSARAVVSPQGRVTSRTPLGVALVWTPAILLAHAGTTVASWAGAQVATDGFSIPYQAAATLTSFWFGALALLLAETLLRRFYPPAVSLLGALALWLATPLGFYAVANPFMSHGVSAGIASLFLVLWLRSRGRADSFAWLLMGAVGALMTLVRIQDGVLLALPLLDLALDRRPGWWRQAVALTVGPAVGGVAQALVWVRLWSQDFVRQIGTQGPGFTLDVQVASVLWSPRHGLFVWTPLYLLAVLGWALWLRRDARLATLMGLGFTLSLLLNASIGDWWGSEGFGQRRFLGLTALFGLGLGEMLVFLRRRPLVLLTAMLGGLVAWNGLLAQVYNSQVVARRSEAVNLEQLLPAQLEVVFRKVMRLEHRLPPRVFFFLYENLKGVWLDEGPRSLGGQVDLGREPPDLPAVVGHNWSRPESRDGVSFRRSRGRRAWLRIPISTLGDFEARLRARSEMGEVPLLLALEVNGQSLGAAPLPGEWSELSFRVPCALLRQGFNEVALVFSTTPADQTPGFRGRNDAAAVDWFRMRRLDRRNGPV